MTTPITLHLTQQQAQSLHTFLWTATIPWQSIGSNTNRKQLERDLEPIFSQLDPHVTYATSSRD